MEEIQKKIQKLRSDYSVIEEKHAKTSKETEAYKTRFEALKKSATTSLQNCVNHYENVCAENQLLHRKNFRELPEEFHKVLKVTDEYLRVRNETEKLKDQVDRCSETMVSQEMWADELRGEVEDARKVLEKYGIKWAPETTDVPAGIEDVQIGENHQDFGDHSTEMLDRMSSLTLRDTRSPSPPSKPQKAYSEVKVSRKHQLKPKPTKSQPHASSAKKAKSSKSAEKASAKPGSGKKRKTTAKPQRKSAGKSKKV